MFFNNPRIYVIPITPEGSKFIVNNHVINTIYLLSRILNEKLTKMSDLGPLLRTISIRYFFKLTLYTSLFIENLTEKEIKNIHLMSKKN